jgi:hypothetical protein
MSAKNVTLKNLKRYRGNNVVDDKTNYLTNLRDFYGFRSKKKTAYTLAFAVIGSLLFGFAFAITQVVLFATGFILNKIYP